MSAPEIDQAGSDVVSPAEGANGAAPLPSGAHATMAIGQVGDGASGQPEVTDGVASVDSDPTETREWLDSLRYVISTAASRSFCFFWRRWVTSAQVAHGGSGQLSQRLKMSKLATALVALLGVAALNGMAIEIVVTPDAGLSANPAALAAFNRAGQAWSSKFTNPITINIAAGLTGGFAPNHIGNASSVRLPAPYDFFRGKIVAAAAGEPDDTIVAALPTLAQFNRTLPPGVVFNGKFSATKANFKAVGYMDLIDLDAVYGATDATITFNNAFAFDYDNSNGVSPGMIDFQTVAEHEIGHALGFISAVDGVDIMKNGGVIGETAITPLDLFRFRDGVVGQDPTTLAEFTSFPRYLNTGGVAIFDDLLTETSLGTGQLTGDGDEASHWKNDNLTGQLLGVMDGSLYGGELHPITAADIRALDLIGYRYIAPVPEPAAALLLACGACGAAFVLRRPRPRPSIKKGQDDPFTPARSR